MKHGVRFWRKKLGRTPSHRASLLRNLLTQLVYHERIETTLAKAKFMQRQADKLIEWVKRGTPQDLKKAKDMLFVEHITFNKLRGPLTARYATRKGGYTRLHMNGFRGLASDRAPLAIIELVDNPNDIIHGLAKVHLSKMQTQLAEVESKLYKRTVIPIQDPMTGESGKVVRLQDRHDVPGRDKRKLNGREKALVKMIGKMEKALKSYPLARAAEQAHAEKARAERALDHKQIVEAVQKKLDESIDKAAEEPAYQLLGGAFSAALADAQLVITPGTVAITRKEVDYSRSTPDILVQEAQTDFVARVRENLNEAIIAAAERFPGTTTSSASPTSTTPATSTPVGTSAPSSSASSTPFGPDFEAKFTIDEDASLTMLPSAAERAYEGIGASRVNPVHLDDYVRDTDVDTVLLSDEADVVPRSEREVPDDVLPRSDNQKPSTFGRIWGKLTGGNKE
ncbi:hypothetical protein PhCBS80983_g05240 [Powellomyces hirtus]|uniref:Ribosomal protein L17 n=1 Tax=Powellomyces hirtus TaxID=109895 RepID=A0A507DUV7_9FUNG|nr:hypothetical protein PhCBS80983_g05240 [Powellomyces hirtus]